MSYFVFWEHDAKRNNAIIPFKKVNLFIIFIAVNQFFIMNDKF